MTAPSEQTDALPDVASVLAAHIDAVKAWLAASPAERPHHWRAVEAAWRKVKLVGAADEAKRNAASLATHSGKLRSNQS